MTPLQAATGQRPDISAILRFHFWEPVYYILDEDENNSFPSKSTYKLGWFAGFAENVGNIMCCKIFTADSQEMIPRSRVISAAKDFPLDTTDSDKHDIEMGKEKIPIIKSFSEDQKQKCKCS